MKVGSNLGESGKLFIQDTYITLLMQQDIQAHGGPGHVFLGSASTYAFSIADPHSHSHRCTCIDRRRSLRNNDFSGAMVPVAEKDIYNIGKMLKIILKRIKYYNII